MTYLFAQSRPPEDPQTISLGGTLLRWYIVFLWVIPAAHSPKGLGPIRYIKGKPYAQTQAQIQTRFGRQMTDEPMTEPDTHPPGAEWKRGTVMHCHMATARGLQCGHLSGP